jgi:hypothetical protein
VPPDAVARGGGVRVLTMVAAQVPADRAGDVRAAYAALLAQPRPDGLLETSLLREGDDWAIATRWRDRAALDAMRASTATPPAVALFAALGARPRVAVFDVVLEG